MEVRNNYNECITNLACSIQKYFGIEPKHNTIDYIDEILNEKQPTNVVMILFDGMGSRILDRTLGEDSFFNRNKVKDITTVFPATTTAATTSIITGLNPVEHGWLGWNMYIKPINKTITLFKNKVKGTEKVSNKFLEVKHMIDIETITEQINKKGKYKSKMIYPFGDDKYLNLDDMFEKIKKECEKNGKKYIYAYNEEPDGTMHMKGPDKNIIKKIIFEIEKKVEEFCRELKDTMVIIVADHGHKLVEPIYLDEYPEILKMIERTPSLEQRAVSFKVKEKYKSEFPQKFKEIFGNDMKIYSKEEIIESKLFGDGEANELFEDALGDYIAIAYETGKCIVSSGDDVYVSHHAGYSDDEIYVPLILVDKC
jgi:predicted AlkP superfamily pyrophosphatase or phosphodiesterase